MRSRVIVALSGLLFTAGLSAQDLPDGWGPVGNALDDYTLSVSRQAGREGRGLRIVGENAGENVMEKFGGVGQTISATDYVGRKVRLSGYMRTIGVDGVGGIWLRIDGKDDTFFLDNMLDRGPTATTDWQEYSAVLPVAEDARRIVFGVILSGIGELHADELNLEIVPDDTPTTVGAGSMRRAPRNMSF